MSSVVRVAMLGLSGAGKTHVCKSLYQMLEERNSDYGMYLTAYGKTNREILENKNFLRNYAPETRNHFTKVGTEGVWELPIALCVTYRAGLPMTPVLKIPILDYAGGIVKTVASGMKAGDSESRRNAERLSTSIFEADIIMLLADANILSEDARPDAPLEDIEKAIAEDINDIFSAFVESPDQKFVRRPRTVLLLLTKCDSQLIAPSLKNNKYAGLIARARCVFAPIVRMCQRLEWSFAVVTTSACGEGNAITERLGFGQYVADLKSGRRMEPYGFDAAFAYGLMRELEYRVNRQMDTHTSATNMEGLSKKQQEEVERLSRRELKAQLRLYWEMCAMIERELNDALNRPNAECIIVEDNNSVSSGGGVGGWLSRWFG